MVPIKYTKELYKMYYLTIANNLVICKERNKKGDKERSRKTEKECV